MNRIRTTLTEDRLAAYVSQQLSAFFPDGRPVPENLMRDLVRETMPRLEHCFSRIADKYFFDGKAAVFNHLHGDQYAMFLYLLANTAHRRKADENIPEKIFLLNKTLHGIDAFYEVELPSVFLFVHPLGTVLGRGSYSDHLLVYQRCGVGSNHGVYPQLGSFVTLRPGASVLGKSRVGENSTVAAESLLLDRDLADDSVYIGTPRDFIVRPAVGREGVWRSL